MWAFLTVIASLLNKPVIQIERREVETRISKTGIEVIDQEHLNIILLFENIKNSNCHADYLENCNRALLAIGAHLVAEEEFMADNGYPGLRLHRLEHNSLYNFINVFLKPHIKEGFDKNEIIGECKRVFKYHIDKYDLPYALFLNERQNVA